MMLENVNGEVAQAFVDLLITVGVKSYDNLVALARYGNFFRNNAPYVAVLEMLDGEKAFEGLYRYVMEIPYLTK